MIVYVIMGNDFPSRVFSSETRADQFVAEKKAEEDQAKAQNRGRRIYWRSYAFELDAS